MVQREGQKCACMHAVYAREVSHRAANAIQTAMAAIHIGRKGDTKVLEEAIKSLSSSFDIHRMLGVTDHVITQAGLTVWNACKAVISEANADGQIKMHLVHDGLLADLQELRPVLMIAVELVTNSVAHAFPDRTGNVTVSIEDDGLTTTLIVEDDGVCLGWSRPGGQGCGIVDSLAASMNGSVLREITADGSGRVTFTVSSIASAAGHALGSA